MLSCSTSASGLGPLWGPRMAALGCQPSPPPLLRQIVSTVCAAMMKLNSFSVFPEKNIQNPANLLRRGALRTCNDPSLSHVSTSRLCRGRLLVFAVQSIMTLLETAIANMVELVLLIIALSLIEAKTFFCSVWCHPEPLPFDLPLEEVDLPCLWDSTRPNATGDRTACCIRRGA